MLARLFAVVLAIVMVVGAAAQLSAAQLSVADVAGGDGGALDDSLAQDLLIAPDAVAVLPVPARSRSLGSPTPLGASCGRMHAVSVFRPPRSRG